MKNKALIEALNHVRTFFPDVTTVVINRMGQWCYMDDNFDSPNFEGTDINTSILEEAADSITSRPFIYQI